ncbi:efflux RND transporter periplasmic adaptor subunit [Myxococcota bacterium]|nr:efflux RND transporter periplasmic adaptor subunit [Myxococcota bacterium]
MSPRALTPRLAAAAVPLAIALVLLLVGIAFRDALVAWFTGAGAEGAGSPGAPAASAPGHAHAEGEISHYTCPMHPSVRQDGPGQCPLCGMDLVPVYEADVASGTVSIDAQRRQQIGVRTEAVGRREASIDVRAVGRIAYDRAGIVEISPKVGGWVRDLRVNEVGQAVSAGQVLFTLYSPEVYAAQRELSAALASQRAAVGTSAEGRVDALVEAARTRLRLWDLPASHVQALAEGGPPAEAIPVVAPAAGHVVELDVVEGAAVEPGARLYRIVRLDRIWVEADVYERDLPLVKVGQEATVTLPDLPGSRLTGQVGLVRPFLDPATRTARVRISLPNPGLELKPEMFVDVALRVPRGERLVVPDSAVVYAGPRRLVFLDLGDGRLQPREVEVGPKVGDAYEVLSGLEEGDVVVTSANFLVAAESRLRSAVEAWQ